MQEWLKVAQNLPLGHKTRIPCSKCGTDDKSLLVNHGNKAYNAYCFRCGQNPFQMKGEQSLAELKRIKELNHNAYTQKLSALELPSDYTTEIPLQGRLWLYKGSITESTWKTYGIGYSEKLQRVVLPVYNSIHKLVWYQCRAIHNGQSPKYIQPSSNRETILFQSLNSGNCKRAIVVEDILSAIRVGKQQMAYSLLGTKITTAQANYLSKYSRVTTWLDPDKAGTKGAYNIRKALQLVTKVDNIVTDKDPKCLSDKEIREALCLNQY